MLKGFSTSTKRATVLFTLPGIGRSIVQEDAGTVDKHLRSAIQKARAVFWKEYAGVKSKKEQLHAPKA